MVSRARAKTVDELADLVEQDVNLDSSRSINALLMDVPEMRRFMVSTAIRCLDAHRCYYDKSQKQMVEIPDGNTQMRAVAFLAAYSDGLPTQTTLNVNLGEKGKASGGELTVDQAMAASPALRSKLRTMLEQAEKTAGKLDAATIAVEAKATQSASVEV